METPDELEPIQLSEDEIVEINLKMINLTGIPDEAFTLADDVWGNDQELPMGANGTVNATAPLRTPTPPKSV